MLPANISNGFPASFRVPQNTDNLLFRKPFLLHDGPPSDPEILTFRLVYFLRSRPLNPPSKGDFEKEHPPESFFEGGL